MSEFIPLLEESQSAKSKVLYLRASASIDELANAAEKRCMAALGLLEMLSIGEFRHTPTSVDVEGIMLLVSDALSLYLAAFEKLDKISTSNSA